jgi:hypothetical protein
VAETDQEQLDYGNVTCVHGMNLGTSGGADFMCGECESGFTERVTHRELLPKREAMEGGEVLP